MVFTNFDVRCLELIGPPEKEENRGMTKNAGFGRHTDKKKKKKFLPQSVHKL